MSSDDTPVTVEGIGKVISRKGKPKYMENLSQCHFFHHKTYVETPVRERRSPRSEPGGSTPELLHDPWKIHKHYFMQVGVPCVTESHSGASACENQLTLTSCVMLPLKWTLESELIATPAGFHTEGLI